jgi:hypothetical protein
MPSLFYKPHPHTRPTLSYINIPSVYFSLTPQHLLTSSSLALPHPLHPLHPSTPPLFIHAPYDSHSTPYSTLTTPLHLYLNLRSQLLYPPTSLTLPQLLYPLTSLTLPQLLYPLSPLNLPQFLYHLPSFTLPQLLYPLSSLNLPQLLYPPTVTHPSTAAQRNHSLPPPPKSPFSLADKLCALIRTSYLYPGRYSCRAVGACSPLTDDWWYLLWGGGGYTSATV